MKIRDIYIVHHSHTDIGYTDLQEQVVYNQVQNIRNVTALLKKAVSEGGPEKDFKWNCETFFCVEKFLERAEDAERADFFSLVKRGRIGISASYLNFCDLADCGILGRKTAGLLARFAREGIAVKCAMNADINGISLGARDVLLDNGVEFLYTNIHTHHGMYPLYQNQKPFFWERENGDRLLVWNGEHYNLGNALGIVFNRYDNSMTERYFGENGRGGPLEILYRNLCASVEEYEQSGYPYDFYITSVSGVFSDNAPANPGIAHTVRAFNEAYGDQLRLRMVTLQELYDLIRQKTADAPVYRGAMNDWWGNGVGSTPYAVKHYREALRLFHIGDVLERKVLGAGAEQAAHGIGVDKAAECESSGLPADGVRAASCEEPWNAHLEEGEESALLYAEHTWGHSSTISNPYDTMVADLDIRKTGYASKAYEAAAMRKIELCHRLGDRLRYYDHSGRVKAVSMSRQRRTLPVEFYVESGNLRAVKVTDEKTGEELRAQISAHPRGVLVSFLTEFEALEEKTFRYEEQPWEPKGLYSRTAWVGADRVRDIVNGYDTESWKLPYGLENDWFRIGYRIGEGITSFFDKKRGTELLKGGLETFFTPILEQTPVRGDAYGERNRLGRNVRGLHAVRHQGVLKNIRILDNGPVFSRAELEFDLPGTRFCSDILKLYKGLPRVEFTCRTAKQLSEDIESVYLPLSLELPDAALYIRSGGVPMRPGIDQLPGTNMEYYVADQGVLYHMPERNVLISTLDTPLLYMGRMEHHPIVLCDGKEENNRRPVYSWIMNNTWETNFKMDLSGFGEFRYALELTEGGTLEDALERLADDDMGTVAFITA